MKAEKWLCNVKKTGITPPKMPMWGQKMRGDALRWNEKMKEWGNEMRCAGMKKWENERMKMSTNSGFDFCNSL